MHISQLDIQSRQGHFTGLEEQEDIQFDFSDLITQCRVLADSIKQPNKQVQIKYKEAATSKTVITISSDKVLCLHATSHKRQRYCIDCHDQSVTADEKPIDYHDLDRFVRVLSTVMSKLNSSFVTLSVVDADTV